jgi:hypothetical protein
LSLFFNCNLFKKTSKILAVAAASLSLLAAAADDGGRHDVVTSLSHTYMCRRAPFIFIVTLDASDLHER